MSSSKHKIKKDQETADDQEGQELDNEERGLAANAAPSPPLANMNAPSDVIRQLAFAENEEQGKEDDVDSPSKNGPPSPKNVGTTTSTATSSLVVRESMRRLMTEEEDPNGDHTKERGRRRLVVSLVQDEENQSLPSDPPQQPPQKQASGLTQRTAATAGSSDDNQDEYDHSSHLSVVEEVDAHDHDSTPFGCWDIAYNAQKD